ncbi:NAD-dependent epimerase/dehydratase family protein [Alkalihalobacillus sp. CinArs1]|uniref:NAD-dependent epimerase/dehydratase family protein n=1 Tax=Alkalihalobacillus sp. CinArs1 TaxID=2995314 RepID=UPI0022DE1996|nr:NAD(P)-dependent oxidoreductase [Alkalihalobacillus sp. CinArs1]
MQTVLITGAAGKIGRNVVEALGKENTYKLRLADINEDGLKAFQELGYDVIRCDVSNLEECQNVCEGIDVVIHLAGNPSPDASFYDALLDGHIKGTYNMFQASKENNVSKVIVASSAQTIEGYPLDYQVHESTPPRPKNMYGVCKCFVEAVACYYAYEEDVQSVAIRIGAYDDYQPDGPALSARDMSAYVSPQDFNDLLLKTLNTENLPPYTLLHAVSNNRFKRLNLDETKKQVGYDPQSDAFKQSGFLFFDHDR